MPRPLTAEAVIDICDHMNADHGDAVALYARVFGKVPEVLSARMRSLDASGMELDVATAAGNKALHIPFDHPLADADDARVTLIAMARHPG